MASKLAICNTDYDDERFEHAVSPSFHCIICTNVIKDPVACRHNEHLFCRACITEHLRNYQTCPSCMDPLTLDTLSQAPRTVTNLLAELKIRCEFFDRGCGKFIELGNLESHLRECGFAPAVCSNVGCQLEVNKRDLLHHETAVCELRRVECHSCNEIRLEVDTLKVKLAAVIEKLETIEANGKAVEENLIAKVGLVQEQLKLLNKQEESTCRQLNKQAESNLRLEAESAEMTKSLNEITKQLERVSRQTLHEIQVEKEQMKKGIAEAAEMDDEPKIVVAGGATKWRRLKCVEMFSLSSGTWTRLLPMKEGREGASSVVYNNQPIVMGGYVKSMEKLLNAVETDQPITRENVPAELPGRLAGHCSVVYSGQCIVIGGYNPDRSVYSRSITAISLVPPYSSKLLATMQKSKCCFGVVLFEDVIVIVGGRENFDHKSAFSSVVMFHITKKECEELAPLPYAVYEMATVKWGDNNVIIIGGVDSDGEALNTVLIYNLKTQKSYVLPDMKKKRRGCVAAVVRETVIVMGGKDERGNYLKSVESFRFDRYTWEEFPEMQEVRYRAVAVAF